MVDKDGKLTKDNSLTSDKDVKSRVNNWVNISMDKEPDTFFNWFKINEVAVEELKNLMSALISSTEDKSTAPEMPSPLTEMSPSKVGQAFNRATSAIAVIVVENEHDEEAANAPDNNDTNVTNFMVRETKSEKK
jgi:hypothetical protein